MREDSTGQDRPAGSPRRTVLAMGSIGMVGAAAALTGCAVYGRQPDPPPPPPPAGDNGDGNGGDGDGGSGDGGSTPVAATADVPVGGGVIEAGLGVVVTQPASGDFRAFSSVCTHQGCTVSEVDNGTINCFCHGSRFSIEDGSVVQAAQGLTPDQQDPLPEVGIVVEGGTISLP
jgi:Rieske Fe-S protein